MIKTALLSIDVEDWFHLDYISRPDVNESQSCLIGAERFRELLSEYEVPGTFFTLSSCVDGIESTLKNAIADGHEVALHGSNHRRPLKMSLAEFTQDTAAAAEKIEQTLGQRPKGYRASCFSLDRARLDLLRSQLGFEYDSSRIDFDTHPLYGSIDLTGFDSVADLVSRKDDFYEFEMPTFKIGRWRLPISGGGYLRIFPWFLLKRLITYYVRRHNYFAVYVHPYELTGKRPPRVKGMGLLTRFRYEYNHKSVPPKLGKLIRLLEEEGFQFMTYGDARRHYGGRAS